MEIKLRGLNYLGHVLRKEEDSIYVVGTTLKETIR